MVFFGKKRFRWLVLWILGRKTYRPRSKERERRPTSLTPTLKIAHKSFWQQFQVSFDQFRIIISFFSSFSQYWLIACSIFSIIFTKNRTQATQCEMSSPKQDGAICPVMIKWRILVCESDKKLDFCKKHPEEKR